MRRYFFNNIFVLGVFICIFISCSQNNQEQTTRPEKKSNPVGAIPAPAVAKNPAVNLKPGATNEKLLRYQKMLESYKFEAFPAKDLYTGKPSPLDAASHIDAALYRKTFTRALSQGANFAGHYTLVTIDCGPNCQDNYILDTRTGKLCDKLTSVLGVTFRLNSRLLLVNDPNSENAETYQNCPNCEPQVYVLQNGLLYKAKLVKD